MNAVLPRLRRITGEYGVAGDVKIRPADVYVSTGYRQPGVVLIGDAFSHTCPVTGTGTDKVFTDVAQLCNVHIPAWLATEGMDTAKIASFYDDPVKQACDAWSMAKPSASARSRSRTGSTGVHSAGRASWHGSAKAPCGGCEAGSAPAHTAVLTHRLHCRLRPDWPRLLLPRPLRLQRLHAPAN